MQTLLAQLTSLYKTGQLIYTDKHCEVAQLNAQALQIRQDYPQLANQNIGLNPTNLKDFVTALIAFDGWCNALYLCPPDVNPPITEVVRWPLCNTQSEELNAVNKNNTKTPSPTTWYLTTSGTTGQPKWYAHTFASLTASTKLSEKLQSLRWALLYQPFRFAGLQVLLQALLSGADLLDATELAPLEQMTRLKHYEVNAISATPSLWRQFLMTGQLQQLDLKHLTLGGEIADQSILNQLKQVHPQAKIRHIYASTEAGVGLVVSDAIAGFPAKWLNNKTVPVALKVSEQQHLLVKPSFKVAEKLAAQTDPDGFFDTQDKVQINEDRVLFLGRVTGTINVGGNKVYPEKVEQVLLQSADIQQAKVYGKNSPLMGQLVVADVVIKPKVDAKKIKMALLTLAKKHLQRFEMPTKINIVEKIAQDPSGKLNRKQ